MHICIKIEKSPLVDLCDHKSSSMHRTIISFASRGRYDPKQAPEYQECVSKIFWTIFFEPQSQEGHSPKLSFWRSSMHVCFKIEKSPLVDLCDHKSSSTHRMIPSFTSTNRYDHKQASKYPQCVWKIFSTKFFGDSKSERPFTKTLFLEVIHACLLQYRKITTSGPLWP